MKRISILFYSDYSKNFLAWLIFDSAYRCLTLFVIYIYRFCYKKKIVIPNTINIWTHLPPSIWTYYISQLCPFYSHKR